VRSLGGLDKCARACLLAMAFVQSEAGRAASVADVCGLTGYETAEVDRAFDLLVGRGLARRPAPAAADTRH